MKMTMVWGQLRWWCPAGEAVVLVQAEKGVALL